MGLCVSPAAAVFSWMAFESQRTFSPQKGMGERHKPAIKESEGENGDAEMKEREISQNGDLLPRNRGEPS